MSMKETTTTERAQVIILTGFLGAGKTTLLNRILTANHGRRIAVIVNEFGEVGIDHDLLISADQEIVQMNNGCICCTVRGDLIRSLFQLLEHRADFDTVLVETTGLADPGPVAQSFLIDERIRSEFTLNGVVTVVDSKHVWSEIGELGSIASAQIAFADLVLLNKTDLVTPEELDALESKIRSINRLATLYRTRNSEVDLAALFEMSNLALAQKTEYTSPRHGEGHNHLKEITAICLVETGELDGMKISHWFRSVIAEQGANIMRMKGIVSLRGDPDRFIFQGVHMIFEAKPGDPWKEGEQRINRLVFIGRSLDAEQITQGFKECIAVGDESCSVYGDPFGRDIEISHFTIDQIRYWMKQIFEFPIDAPVIVKEVPCVKSGCPPIETAIIVVLKGEPPRLFKIQRTINEVTFDHVYNLIENPLPCC